MPKTFDLFGKLCKQHIQASGSLRNVGLTQAGGSKWKSFPRPLQLFFSTHSATDKEWSTLQRRWRRSCMALETLSAPQPTPQRKLNQCELVAGQHQQWSMRGKSF
mmetsp:Transcript_43936/g.88278  ORF Transcript_43936/g.88278 Transcript_43936/m.88278 type:complete len:105 (+) Transcript_43936:52-366(+)